VDLVPAKKLPVTEKLTKLFAEAGTTGHGAAKMHAVSGQTGYRVFVPG